MVSVLLFSHPLAREWNIVCPIG